MRYIKFRAIEYGLEDKENYGERWIYTEDNGRPYFGDCIFDSAEKHIINQYTGVKDKNGKEIYEGDIVKITRAREVEGYRKEQITDIYFDRGAFRYRWKDGSGSVIDFKSVNIVEGYEEITQDVEVISNIYENPDLIK